MTEDTIYRYQPDWLDWNDVDQVRKWVNVPYIHLRGEYGEGKAARTTLSYAVKNSSSAEVIELLVKHGAGLEAQGSDGRTPLMHAASSAENIDVIERLIHLGADLKAEDNHGMTPLVCAVSYNENCDVVERFLKLVADSFPYCEEDYDDSYARENNPYCCYEDPGNWSNYLSPEMRKRAGFNEEEFGIFWDPCMTHDCSDQEWHQLASLAWHLEKRDKSGKTLLMYAAENNQNPNIIEMLINYGADPNAETGVYAWDEYNGNYLVGFRLTPLMYAAKSNPNPDIVEMLVNLGAGVDAQTSSWNYDDTMTPLVYAAESNPNPVVIERLVELGADLNAQMLDHCNNPQGTALWFATLEATKMLIKLGADLDELDYLFMHLVSVGDCEKAELLLKAGADVNVQDYRGRTPLMFAADSSVVEFLIKHGADSNMRDTEGLTALAHALERSENFGAIEQLFSLGSDLSSEMMDTIKKKKEKEKEKKARMEADREVEREYSHIEEIERIKAIKKREEERAKEAISRAERGIK